MSGSRAALWDRCERDGAGLRFNAAGMYTLNEIVARFGALAEAGCQHVIFSVRGVSDTSRLERLGAKVFPQLRDA